MSGLTASQQAACTMLDTSAGKLLPGSFIILPAGGKEGTMDGACKVLPPYIAFDHPRTVTGTTDLAAGSAAGAGLEPCSFSWQPGCGSSPATSWTSSAGKGCWAG